MSGSTTRLGLPYPQVSDPNNVPSDMQSLATAVDGKAVAFATSGTLAARPAAGVHDRTYWASDVGRLYWDDGAAWHAVGVDGLVTAKGDLLVGASAGTVAKLPRGGDGQVLTARASAANGVDWESPASALLAVTSYSPTTPALYSLSGTGSAPTTLTAADATNLKTTPFAVPASGRVLARLTGHVPDVQGATVWWGLLDGSTIAAWAWVAYNGTASVKGTRSPSFLITGLTPGQTKTYTWGIAAMVNGTAYVLGAGGVFGTTTGSQMYGPAVMEVWAA